MLGAVKASDEKIKGVSFCGHFERSREIPLVKCKIYI